MSGPAAIPTNYKGLLFRSRLEAQWAHFFDNLGWNYEYEPFDLNGYIPDFVLKFDHAPVLVEVKPCLVLSEFDDHKAKIERSGWNGEALIVGATLFPPPQCCYVGGIVIGAMWQREAMWTNQDYWYDASLNKCDDCGMIVPVPSEGDIKCCACGKMSDKGGLFFNRDEKITDCWHEAKNATQWSPSGRRP